MKLVFLGPPGAGKGTQAKVIAKELHIPHISTGDIFRENIKNKTELGIKAQEYNDKGMLVPDEITNEMVKLRLQDDDCSNGYILDGYPRTLPQAEFLKNVQDIDKAVYFKLSDEISMQRMIGRSKESNRTDDNIDIIKNRIVVYKKQTQPLIDFYTKEKLLLEIDASPSVEEISKITLSKLE